MVSLAIIVAFTADAPNDWKPAVYAEEADADAATIGVVGKSMVVA